MMRGQQITEAQRPAAPPLSLEAGRLDTIQLLIFAAVGIVLLLLAFLSGQLAVAVTPDYGEATGNRALLIWGSTVMALLLGGLGLYVLWLPLGRERAHYRRVQDWHVQALEERQLSGGLEIERTASAWELDADIPLHMLALVIGLHMRVQERRSTAPWSVRNMEGPLMIGGGNSMIKLLEVPEHEARLAGQTLAQLGLVRGRGDKSAGEWVPQSLEEAVRLLADNWKRV